MADAMEAFSQKKDSNYDSVRDRLRKSERFTEAHSVLETGYKFLQRGFEVIFDSTITITINRKDGSHNKRVPVWVLKISSEQCYARISQDDSTQR
jgi:hypothetical protein